MRTQHDKHSDSSAAPARRNTRWSSLFRKIYSHPEFKLAGVVDSVVAHFQGSTRSSRRPNRGFAFAGESLEGRQLLAVDFAATSTSANEDAVLPAAYPTLNVTADLTLVANAADRTLTFTIANLGSTDGLDYTSSTLSYDLGTNNYSAATVRLDNLAVFAVNSDTTVEPDEQVQITVGTTATSGPLFGAVGNVQKTTTHTITNEDTAKLSFSTVGGATLLEGATPTFYLTLNNAVQGGVKADWTAAPRGAAGVTAEIPTDFSTSGSTLSFTGNASEKLSVPLVFNNDGLVEVDEQYKLKISSISLPGGVDPSKITFSSTLNGTITNDDLATIEFSQATGSDVESAGGNRPVVLVTGQIEDAQGFDLSQAGTAGNPSDYSGAFVGLNIAPGSYAATPLADFLTVTSDTLVEPTESVTLGFTLPSTTGLKVGVVNPTTTYTITDDDSAKLSITNAGTVAEGATGTFTIALTQASQENTQVTYTVAGTAGVGLDYSPLLSATIPAGSTSVPLNVLTSTDNLLEFQESVVVTIMGFTPEFVGDDRLISVNGAAAQGTLLINDVAPVPADLNIDLSTIAPTDYVKIQVVGNELQVLDNLGNPIPGLSPLMIPGSTGQVNVIGDGDNNTLEVDASVINSSLQVKYDGKGQTSTPGDLLIISGAALNGQNVTYSGDDSSAGAGTVDFNDDGVDVTYTGLEPVLVPTIVAGNVTFNLTKNADDATLKDNGAGKLQLFSNNATFEHTTFAVPTGKLTINALGGGDTLTVATSAIDLLNSSSYLNTVYLNGGGADDTFNLQHGTSGHTSGVNLNVNGNAGTNNVLNIPAGNVLNVQGGSDLTLANLVITDPADDGLAPLHAAGASTTLVLNGVTMNGLDAFIEMDSPESDVDLDLLNNTFNLTAPSASGAFFVQNDVPAPVLPTDVEGNSLNAVANEDTPLTLGVKSDARTVLAGASSPNGSVVVNPNGSLTFTPSLNFTGATTVNYTLSGVGAVGGAAGVININVLPVNDAPVNSLPAAYNTPEDTPVLLSTPSLGVTDPDSAALMVTLSVASGTLSVGTVNGSMPGIAGNGTANLVLTGTVAQINSVLQDITDTDGLGPDGLGVTFTPAANFNGPVPLTMTSTDFALTDVDGSVITVGAVNDPPTIANPGAFGIFLENSVGNPLAGISVADDAIENGGDLVVILTVTKGTLDVNQLAVGGVPAGDIVGDTTATLQLTGTVAEINTTLATLLYTPLGDDYKAAGDPTDDDALKISVNDQGNAGVGGAKTTTVPSPFANPGIPIMIDGVNDAPINKYLGVALGLPIPNVATNEDTQLNLPGISVSDVDAHSGSVSTTLSVGSGTLVATASGAAAIVGANTAVLTVTGNLTDLNATLASLKYTPTLDFNGVDLLDIDTTDLGNTGLGGALTDLNDTIKITVNGVNDAPVITAQNPNSQTVNEEGLLVFNALNTNKIKITDVDLGGNNMEVKLTVLHGTLTLGSIPGGLSFSVGDGTADTTMTFQGTQSQVNNALDGLQYSPALNYYGPETLAIHADDLGNSPAPGKVADLNVLIAVNPVNDAPINLFQGLSHQAYPIVGPPANTNVSTNEDTALTFKNGNLNDLEVSDIDAPAGVDLQLSLTVANGTLTLATTAGLTFGVGDGTGDATMTFQGTTAELNAALEGLVYLPNANYSGADTLTIVTNDLGNTGPGALTDTDVVNITVVGQNDPPSFTIAGTIVVPEDAGAIVSVGYLSNVLPGPLSDLLELATQNVVVSLSAPSNPGLFTVAPTWTSSGTTNSTHLAPAYPGGDSLQFTLAPNVSGSSVFSISAVDNGVPVASFGPLNFLIIVTPNNDAPTIASPGAVTTNEDTNFAFGIGLNPAITVDDDAKFDVDNEIDVDLTVDKKGTLTLGSTAGLTGLVGNNSAAVSFSGTVSEINAALLGLTFVPAANANNNTAALGAATLSIKVDDLGQDGGGPALITTNNVTVNITPVNDPVTVKAPGFLDMAVPESSPPSLVPLGTNLIFGSNYFDDADKNDLPPNSVTITTTVDSTTLAGLVTPTVSGSDLKLTYAANASGSSVIKVTATDGLTSISDTFTVTVNAKNDPPTITHTDQIAFVIGANPSAGNDATIINEDNQLTFAGADLITVGDVDDASLTVTLAIPAGKGKLDLSTTAGLTVVGNGTNSLSVVGLTANINAALNGMKYTPAADLNTNQAINENVPLQITATDGLPQSAALTVDIHINPVNDNPIGVADSYSVNEGSVSNKLDVMLNLKDLTGPATALDELSQTLKIVGLTDADGIAPGFQTVAGGTIVIGPTPLLGLWVEYTPPTNYYGADSFQYIIRDDGSPNLDSLLTTVTLNVQAVNDPPIIDLSTGPGAINEDTPLPLAFIDVQDDTPGGQANTSASNVLVNLTANNGSFSIDNVPYSVGVVGIPGGVQLSGTVANINAALNDADSKYVPNLDYNGAEVLSGFVQDLGNIGGGPNLTDTDTLTLTINSVNDPPALQFASNVTVAQNSGAQVVAGFVTGRLPAGHLPTPADEAGQIVTITATAESSDPNNVVSAVNVDNATGNLTFTVAPNVSGIAQIDVTSQDNGPGTPSTVQTFTITVGINQEPLATITGNAGQNIQVLENSGISVFPNFLTGLLTGTPHDFPPAQIIQSVTITTDNPLLFSSQPQIAPLTQPSAPATGTGLTLSTPGFGSLAFTTAANASGVANATLTIVDNGGVANGGDNTKVINFTITVTPVGGGGPGDVAGPVVTDIKVKGSAWTAAYINLVDAVDKVGYSIPDGANQAQGLPWGNLNQLIIEFNEPVKGSGIGPIGTVGAFAATDFALLGENTVAYAIAPLAYDALNFRLTLAVPTLPVDRYALIMNDVTVKDANNNNLDGEWDQNVDVISGNGTNGGLFEYLFNVLPGNFALNDTVTNGLDLGVLGLAYNTQLGVHANYNKFADANGDGFINGLDLGVYGLNLGVSLPVGDPRNPLDAVAASVDSVFGQDDDAAAASEILDDDSIDSIADSITVKGARSRGAFLG